MKRFLLAILCSLTFATSASAQVEIPAVQITGALPIFAQSATPFGTGLGSGACAVITGAGNTCFGYDAGLVISTGTNNTAIGANSLKKVTTGGSNTSVGSNAASNISTVSATSAFGVSSLSAATGNNNSCFGSSCLLNDSTGHDNTSIGFDSGNGITTWSDNLILGECTGLSATTGSAVDLCTGDNVDHLDWNITNAAEWTITGNIVNAGTVPTIGSGACGATTNGSVAGTDNSGFITIGASATTSCTVSFHATLAVAPKACVVYAANAAAAVQQATVATGVYVSAPTTSAFTITAAVMANTLWQYICL